MKIQGKKLTERNQVISTLKRLKPGDSIDLQLGPEGKLRLKCQLMGFEETKYLALCTPESAMVGHDRLLATNTPCIIRTIVEADAGQCIAFKSEITASIKKPYGLIFINYPTKIELYDLRKEQRVPTRVPTLISSSNENEDISYDGVILDLSTGGCRLAIPWMHPLKSFLLKQVNIKMMMPSRPNEPLIVSGEVKGKSLTEGKLTLGVKFDISSELIELFSHLNLQDEIQQVAT